KRKCEIVGHLTANGNDNSQRPLFRADTENALQAQFFEIESVALVVVRADGFRVAVHNNGMVAKLPQCLYGIHRTPIELHRAAGSGSCSDSAFKVYDVFDFL